MAAAAGGGGVAAVAAASGWMRISKRTSFDLATDVPRLSGVSCPSHDNEQRVLVGGQAEVCGAPRLLLPDLPLRHPAARHVGQLTVGM